MNKTWLIAFLGLMMTHTIAEVSFEFDRTKHRSKTQKEIMQLVDGVIAGDFEKVERKIQTLSEAVKKNPDKIFELEPKMKAFAPIASVEADHFDEKISSSIEKWLAHSPNRPEPYYAKSNWLKNVAWKARGNRFADKTDKKALEKFYDTMRESGDYARKAIAFDPDHPLAILYHINNICIIEGIKCLNAQKALLLKRTYQDFRTHDSLIQLLAPKWFGKKYATKNCSGIIILDSI